MGEKKDLRLSKRNVSCTYIFTKTTSPMRRPSYQISQDGLQMDPEKARAVLSWQPPRTKRELQKFWGFANFYHRFISHFSCLTAPLTDLLKEKGRCLNWPPNVASAFDTFKRHFASENQLIHPGTSAPFVLQTDASNKAIEAVLLQPQKSSVNDLRPVVFYSRKLSSSEWNNTIWEK
ncbi:uncharacterized mitochondrial protein AtMg00860-like [Varanus komodoensis]|uniref:uncharacterized mitochondrial protein AtMg00860-like n=1 Tax=Varanus komodoensis TaxID=61221 RepID=UPI001CF7B1F0|nr:uncharacterized mitochondrial protein AtMg00860-like [Varanus komodoensis]